MDKGEEMKAKVVVLGNEKGGTGKSTLAMHLIITWLREGKKVAALDLDGRQGTLSRYLQNRKAFSIKNGLSLPMPDYVRMNNISNELLFLRSQLERLADDYDIIVLDTPGADTALTQEALFQADTLITPVNDSLLDLDILGVIDEESFCVKGPSHYAERIWSVRQKRNLMKKETLDWIVVRNRLSPLKTKNKQIIENVLKTLAERIHFSISGTVTDRVVFRELFLKGLTMMDLREDGLKMPLSISSIAARQEVRLLANAVFKKSV